MLVFSGGSMFKRLLPLVLLTAAMLAVAPAAAQDKFIVVASTTSTEDSGLFGYLLPLFKQKTGIEVRVVAQGTGQAPEPGQGGGREIPRRRLRREALSGHVQRLRADRAAGRPRRRHGQGHRHGAAHDQ